MAAQVLSGTGNVTYTNSTGQNVRVSINYLGNESTVDTVAISFQGVTINLPKASTIGKSIAWASGNVNNRGYQSGRGHFGTSAGEAAPTEIALSNGETFSLTISGGAQNNLKYNIIIIPEAG